MVSKQRSVQRRRVPRPNTTPNPSRSQSSQSRNMDSSSLIGHTMRMQDWLNEKTVKTLQVGSCCYIYWYYTILHNQSVQNRNIRITCKEANHLFLILTSNWILSLKNNLGLPTKSDCSTQDTFNWFLKKS